MSKQYMNLQDSYLNQVRRENADVQILLVTGTSITGHVKGFDNFTVILNEASGQQHLVYKHAIAHVTSRKPMHTKGDRPEQGDDAGEEKPARAPRHGGKERKGGGDQQAQPPKAGFNKLDLSSVKIEAGAKK